MAKKGRASTPTRRARKTIYTRLRAALPHARAILADRGIDADNDLRDYFAAVGGKLAAIPDVDEPAVVKYADAVFVLGMAVGLLLDKRVLERPRAKKGGAK